MKIFRVFMIIIICALAILPTSNGVAFAATEVYSDVLEDLQKDEKFNKDDYPINQTDYSLELIQIAESYSGELLVYVYQPSAGAKGILTKKIRIKYPNSDTYNDYDLTLLSKNGVFFKYKVDGYVTDYDSSTERVYNVVQIMRSASAELGDTVLDENNNKISYVPYPVNWTFTAKYKDGSLYYGKEKLESVLVSDKYCGQLRFSNDPVSDFIAQLEVGLEGSARMLHFIAFNTDEELNNLVGADVRYTLCTLSETKSGNIFTAITGKDNHSEYITATTLTKPLSAYSSESYQSGLFGHTYSWKEIMTKDDFVNNVVSSSSAFFNSSLTESAVSEISDKKWVLCFASTDIYSMDRAYGFGSWETKNQCSYITDETILSLTVNRNGNLYTLGVVDNYQTGDGVPDNKEDYGINEDWWSNRWAELEEWIKIIVTIIGIVVIGIVLIIVLPPLWKFIKFIFKIIFAPFRLLFRSSARSNNKSTYRKRR